MFGLKIINIAITNKMNKQIQQLKQKEEEIHLIIQELINQYEKNEILVANYLSEGYDRNRDDEADEELNFNINAGILKE